MMSRPVRSFHSFQMGAGSDSPAESSGRDVYIPFPSDQKRFGENVVFDRNSSQPPEKLDISQVTVAVQSTDQVKPTARILESIIEEVGKQRETVVTVPLATPMPPAATAISAPAGRCGTAAC